MPTSDTRLCNDDLAREIAYIARKAPGCRNDELAAVLEVPLWRINRVLRRNPICRPAVRKGHIARLALGRPPKWSCAKTPVVRLRSAQQVATVKRAAPTSSQTTEALIQQQAHFILVLTSKLAKKDAEVARLQTRLRALGHSA